MPLRLSWRSPDPSATSPTRCTEPNHRTSRGSVPGSGPATSRTDARSTRKLHPRRNNQIPTVCTKPWGNDRCRVGERDCPHRLWLDGAVAVVVAGSGLGRRAGAGPLFGHRAYCSTEADAPIREFGSLTCVFAGPGSTEPLRAGWICECAVGTTTRRMRPGLLSRAQEAVALVLGDSSRTAHGAVAVSAVVESGGPALSVRNLGEGDREPYVSPRASRRR